MKTKLKKPMKTNTMAIAQRFPIGLHLVRKHVGYVGRRLAELGEQIDDIEELTAIFTANAEVGGAEKPTFRELLFQKIAARELRWSMFSPNWGQSLGMLSHGKASGTTRNKHNRRIRARIASMSDDQVVANL